MEGTLPLLPDSILNEVGDVTSSSTNNAFSDYNTFYGDPAKMASQRFCSEVFVPIRKDSQTFEDRQKGILEADSMRVPGHGSELFDDMQKLQQRSASPMMQRMAARRSEWEHEVDSMRKDFFRLKPMEMRKGSSENLLDSMRLDDIFSNTSKGDKQFRVSFDVSQFTPEEISVRTEESKLMVSGKHENKGDGSSMSREFSRQIDVPAHVDPQKLTCTLSKDGILQVEAAVDAPSYDQIRAAAPASSLNNAANTRHAQSSHSSHMTSHNAAHAPLQSPLTSGFVTSSPGSAASAYSANPGTMVTEEEGSKKLKLEVDIGKEFLPEEIAVKTVDRKLMVSARHEEKTAGRTSVREFSREFDLPADVDPNLVTASMTDDGRLLVEAPITGYSKGSYQGRPGSQNLPKVEVRVGPKS